MHGFSGAPQRLDAATYRTPIELRVAPVPLRRVLLVGSCLGQTWQHAAATAPEPVAMDHLWIGLAPPAPPQPIEAYDLQLVQVPLRAVLPDGALLALPQHNLAAHRALFRTCRDRLRLFLDAALHWNRARGLLTFVQGFPLPQQDPVGRLMPRYDLRNAVHFIERLNHAMARAVAGMANVYFHDIDQVLATHGRRLFQDDAVWALNHAAALGDFDSGFDGERLEPAPPVSALHALHTQEIATAAWQEVVGLYRTVRQADQVKLVVVDLDDTLWRGVIADTPADALPTTEGWPLGLWEALAALRRRGVLLAIISRNEPARVMEAWDGIFQGRLRMADFALCRIGWEPKADAMAGILATLNLLPGSTLFLDDNPVERAAMLAAFPGIRVLGGAPHAWRRVLLWAPETQVATITAESAARTEMAQAQVVREGQRSRLPREAFLAALDVRVTLLPIADTRHARFGRALELINKTNQFNTTGRRWTLEEARDAMLAGTRFLAFDVTDTHTQYGLTGVLVLERAHIAQLVLSCRVMGLDAEVAAVGALVAAARQGGATTVTAALVETDRNQPCRDVWQRCGFTAEAAGWRIATAPGVPVPRHVRVAFG